MRIISVVALLAAFSTITSWAYPTPGFEENSIKRYNEHRAAIDRGDLHPAFVAKYQQLARMLTNDPEGADYEISRNALHHNPTAEKFRALLEHFRNSSYYRA